MKTNLLRASIIIVTTMQLSACGGGGGGSSTTLPVIPDSDTSNPYIPIEPIDLSGLTISPGTYSQQTKTNTTDLWDEGYKGLGVTIGVVDSGLNPNHPDFYDDNGYSRIDWQNARGVVSPDGYSISFNDEYIDIDAPDYHGTHISSIAAGREFGIAPEATLLPVNVFFDESSAYNTAIHAGVDYAASKTPIINVSITQMVNLSIEGGSSSEYNRYLDTLLGSTSVLVTAAGNGGTDSIGDPVGAEHFENYNEFRNLSINSQLDNKILHVIALDNSSDQIASFSNFPGSCSDVSILSDLSCDNTTMEQIQNNFISVPGTAIEAAYGGYDGSASTYSASYSGTSMATPIVSGGLALLLSAWDQLTPQQAVAILKESANNSGVYSDSATYGVGLMDLQAAIAPLGELKSLGSVSTSEPSSLSTEASYSLNESSLKLPSELKNLSQLDALKSVAYFDKYNRDYAIDVSQLIEVDKKAIEWNRFWAKTAHTQQDYDLDEFTLQLTFNPTESIGIESIALSSNDFDMHWAMNSDDHFLVNSNLHGQSKTNHFQSDQETEFGHSFASAIRLAPNLKLSAAVQSSQNDWLAWQNNMAGKDTPISYDKTSHAAGIFYQATANLELGLATQIEHQKDNLFNSFSSGAFAFGEDNILQSNMLTMNYHQGNNQLFSSFKYGKLIDNRAQSGSYFNVNSATMAELKLGWLHNLSKTSLWGLQAYNSNQLIDANITLTLPTGMDANGLTEYTSFDYKHQGKLIADSVEMFYRSNLTSNTQLLFNVVQTPDDKGLGLSLSGSF